MDGVQDSSNAVLDGDQRRDVCCTSSPCTSNYGSIHHIIGGASTTCNVEQLLNPLVAYLAADANHSNQVATDVILWKRRRVSFGVIVVATIAWLLIENSGLSFLSICSDVLFLLTVLFFLRANYIIYRKGQLEELPELVLSEEMVNNAAASFRAKINRVLLIAHDITHGKDFRLFFVVVVCLWLLSVIGSLVSFTTLAYIAACLFSVYIKAETRLCHQLHEVGCISALIAGNLFMIVFNMDETRNSFAGTIISITIPALYSKYEGMVSRFTGSITQRFSQHFRIVDEDIITGRHQHPDDKDD